MPVVNVRYSALIRSLPTLEIDEIMEKLPYVGLDIEGIDKENDIIRVEFNPNRPDFSSENGIIRALKGLFEIETGLPIIRNIFESNYVIDVDRSLEYVRPIIYGLVAKRSASLSDHEISLLISVQEDLHNGVGRKRRKSSIGIHDIESISFPLTYTSVGKQFSFIPLEQTNPFTVDDILNQLQVGRDYGDIVNQSGKFPMLIDSNNNVVSFPPIINSNLTKVNLKTKDLLIEVTSTNAKSGQDMLSILSYELNDMGFDLFSIQVKSPFEGVIKTPFLDPYEIVFSPSYINKILGLELSNDDIIKYLGRSRCFGESFGNELKCMIPRYRIDIFNPIDICEEIAIGYGIYQFTPSYTNLNFSGKKHITSIIFNNVREILIGLGFLEVINTNIMSKKITTGFFVHSMNHVSEELISVGDTKNSEFEVLRNSVLPSLMKNFSTNIHEKYPQKLFEIGKIFQNHNSVVQENWSLGTAIAHNTTDYTEIKSVIESLMKYCFNKEIKTPRIEVGHYLKGHSAKILINDIEIGTIGEIHPSVLENFKLRTLVSSFEINLDKLMDVLDAKKLRYL